MKKHDVIILGMTTVSDMKRGVANRNAQFFYELLQRDDIGKVLFVDFIPFNPKMSLKSALRSRTLFSRFRKQRVTKEMSPNAAGKTFYSLSIAHTRNVENRIWKTMHKLKLENPIGISYHPLYADAFFALPCKTHVFEAVDDWRDHGSYSHLRHQLTAGYEAIDKQANTITTVSEKLRAVFPKNPNVHWLPNGVDLAVIDDLRDNPPPKILDGIPRPIIGYVGVIQQRLDIALLEELARKNPDKSFVFIGPIWPTFLRSLRPKDPQIRRLEQHKNIYLLGYQPRLTSLNAVLHYDVGLIPHKSTGLTQTMNPMKLYEYLACGKPVVSTAVSGVAAFDDLVYIAQSGDDFNNSISQAMEEDGKHPQAKRIKAMQEHSWTKRVDTFLTTVLRDE